MAELINVSIDGRTYRVEASKNLLETCLSLGIDLSYFCWHPSLGSVGSCRQCAVIQFQDQSDTRGRLVMACMTPLAPDMLISVNDDKAKTFRATNIEALMTNHPHDCPVCEEGGDCHLQDMTLMSEHIRRRYDGSKRTHNNQYLGPLLNHEMNRCIGCYRCVRFYRDYCNDDDLNVFGSKNQVYFGRAEPGILASKFSGNLAEICPTGVFTDKTFSEHYCRKWDLQSSPTICHHCSLGCNTYTGSYNKRVRKISNRHNSTINGHFLCDRGRFSYQYANDEQRITAPLRRNADLKHAELITPGDAVNIFKQWLEQANGDIIALGSSRSSIENNVAILHLLEQHQVSGSHFYADTGDRQLCLQQQQIQYYQQNQLAPCSLAELESADCALVIGEDICNTAPRLALCLRQMVRNEGITGAGTIGIAPWQDQPVRNFSQGLKSPLFIISHSDSELQDLARCHQILTLNQQALLLTQIKDHLLNPLTDTQSAADDLTNPYWTKHHLFGHKLARQIARALAQAGKPVIVYGSSYTNFEIQQLVNDIYLILAQTNPRCLFHYVMANANSQALAIISPYANGLDALIRRLISAPPKMLLILEADLDWLCSGPRAQLLYQDCFESIDHVVVIDHLMTATAQMADLLLPAASAFEQQGCWLSSQGQLQLSLATMPPAADRRPAWQWCQTDDQASYNSLLQWCSRNFDLLESIIDYQHQPDSQFKLARQSFRASGRTAINADVDVREYPPASDKLSDYQFSMEGVAPFRQQHSDVKNASGAYIWQPKWNSGQGISKGSAPDPAKVSTPGSDGRSIFPGTITQAIVPPANSPEPRSDSEPTTGSEPRSYSEPTTGPEPGTGPEPLTNRLGQIYHPAQLFTLMPLASFYDSNELSHYCPSLAELMTGNIVKLNQACAELFNWQPEQLCLISLNNQQVRLRCQIEPHCPDHSLLISAAAYKALGLISDNCQFSSEQLSAGATL